jgi:hypothetical protein
MRGSWIAYLLMGGSWGGNWFVGHVPAPVDGGTTDRLNLLEAVLAKLQTKSSVHFILFGITLPIMGSEAAEDEVLVSIEP